MRAITKILGNKTNQYVILILSILLFSCTNHQSNSEIKIAYGDNSKSGEYLEINDAKIYFETYGDKLKTPIVLIHGNGGSIEAMTSQIKFFTKDYFVVVADNRTHGKSSGRKNLSYDIIAKDYIGILDKLNIETAFVLGHSDGGIIGLLMAMNYPDRVSKLVSAVPNLVPGEESIVAWELEFGEQYRALIDSMLIVNDTSRNWEIEKIHMNLMKTEPHIEISDLSKITCPVLVMTSDDDIIKPRHILKIYENIPNAQLFVMPGATHFMIRDEHELYNAMANRFFVRPFTRPKSKEVLMELIGFED